MAASKRSTAEQSVAKLREAEKLQGQGGPYLRAPARRRRHSRSRPSSFPRSLPPRRRGAGIQRPAPYPGFRLALASARSACLQRAGWNDKRYATLLCGLRRVVRPACSGQAGMTNATPLPPPLRLRTGAGEARSRSDLAPVVTALRPVVPAVHFRRERLVIQHHPAAGRRPDARRARHRPAPHAGIALPARLRVDAARGAWRERAAELEAVGVARCLQLQPGDVRAGAARVAADEGKTVSQLAREALEARLGS